MNSAKFSSLVFLVSLMVIQGANAGLLDKLKDVSKGLNETQRKLCAGRWVEPNSRDYEESVGNGRGYCLTEAKQQEILAAKEAKQRQVLAAKEAQKEQEAKRALQEGIDTELSSIYSSVLIYERVCEDSSFFKLNYAALKKQGAEVSEYILSRYDEDQRQRVKTGSYQDALRYLENDSTMVTLQTVAAVKGANHNACTQLEEGAKRIIRISAQAMKAEQRANAPAEAPF